MFMLNYNINCGKDVQPVNPEIYKDERLCQ